MQINPQKPRRRQGHHFTHKSHQAKLSRVFQILKGRRIQSQEHCWRKSLEKLSKKKKRLGFLFFFSRISVHSVLHHLHMWFFCPYHGISDGLRGQATCHIGAYEKASSAWKVTLGNLLLEVRFICTERGRNKLHTPTPVRLAFQCQDTEQNWQKEKASPILGWIYLRAMKLGGTVAFHH